MEGYSQRDRLFIYWIGHRKYVHIQMHLCPTTKKTKNKFNAAAEIKIEQMVKLWYTFQCRLNNSKYY